MAHSSGDAHEYPIYGAHFRIVFPILDADGDLVTGATGLDSERSIDQGTFADCTNEATEIATSSGMYYLDLTGAEMTGSLTAVIVKTSTVGAKTTPITLYPKRTSVLETGTAQAGAATTITLAATAASLNDYYNDLFVLITNDTPSGVRYQARRIVDYVGSTKVATVESAWGTNPSSSSTYEIILPDTGGVSAWSGVKVSPDGVGGGFAAVEVLAWRGGFPNVLVSGRVDGSVGAMASNVLTAASTAADYLAEINAEVDTALADYDGPTFTELDARTDAIEADTQDIQSRLPAALVSSRMDSHVGAVAANAIGDAALGSDMDGYSAKIWLFDDNGGTADRYEVAWFKNSNWIRSGITLPKIQVYKSLDGSDLVGEAAMTEISSLHLFKKTESTNRIVGGASYWAVARATIDGDVREWPQPVGRDST